VGFDGDAPFTFQWTDNGVDITGGTNYILNLLEVSYTENNHKIACILTNPARSLTSSNAILTVIADKTPPTVTNVVTDLTFTNVFVYFDKPVSATALSASNYKISGGLNILSITRVNQSTVELGTGTMPPGTVYQLTVSGVQDMAATPNTIVTVTVPFESFVYSAGGILHKKYNNCADGYTLADFLADPRYPNNPDRQDVEEFWEYPAGGNGRVAADPVRNYIDTLEGFFIPPVTGDYVFYLCGDDEYYLYLSTDDTAANLQQICYEPGGWSDNRAWCVNDASQGYHSGNATNWVSSTYSGTGWPNGNTISLTSGQPYYMLSIHHDHSWSGGDWSGVTYSGGGAPVPTYGDASLLTGSLVAYYFDPNDASVSFSVEPQSASALEGTSVTLTAQAAGSSDYGTNVAYQWQLASKGSTDWTNVAGAIGPSFATPILGLGDNGDQVRVIALLLPISATSSVANLTVTAPVAPPVVSVGAILDQTPGTVDVGVGFNETVEDASGSLQSNYSISSGTISSFLWCSNRFTADSKNPLVEIRKQGVYMTVTGMSGNTATLTVKNVSDTYGNKISSTNVTFTVNTNMHWNNVGGNQLGGWQAVVPVGANGFDVYSDGIAEWANYDETTFAYEAVTGDFDKALRVEYQDGSSEWGRAGIIVRDPGTNNCNFGADAATQEGSQGNSNTPTVPNDGLAGRYQKCHVNPVGATLTGPGTAGNASWEGNRRLDVGGGSTTCLTGVNATPAYPNAWCRIKRTGQTFTIFRSDDGVSWVQLGQTVWGQDDQTKTPMPATVYVGPEFSPENGNIPLAADQGTFLAQFRDYGDYVTVFNPQLTAGSLGRKLTITWTTGTLVSSPTVNGTYTPVMVSGAAATSPLVLSPPTGPAMFYRVQH